tara:strand:+ start:625 stop:1230 length:606 start_codon:yes stop_codon:yes gene_type:complete
MWKNILKVDSVWNENISDERLIYFIWNSLQTNATRTESFYANNYYTFNQVYLRLIADYPDELKRRGEPNTSWYQIRNDLKLYKKHTDAFLEFLEVQHPFVRNMTKIDVDEMPKEQINNIHEFIKDMNPNSPSYQTYQKRKHDVKETIEQTVKILSKRNPKLDYLEETKIPLKYRTKFGGIMRFTETDHLINFKRWLATKVK